MGVSVECAFVRMDLCFVCIARSYPTMREVRGSTDVVILFL